MPMIRASGTAVVDAAPAAVFHLLADYREGHRRILPPKVFLSLEVERGGVGAGTIARCRMRTLGVTREFRLEVTVPVPGRELVETDFATGARTTLRIDPEGGDAGAGGARTRVTISTEWRRGGLTYLLERWLAPRALRGIYREELENLAKLAPMLQAPTDRAGVGS